MMDSLQNFHTDTTVSDGQYTPTVLEWLAKVRGMSVLLATGHDTIAGADKARRAGDALRLRVIRGVEFSAKDHRSFRILGYGFRDEDTGQSRLHENYGRLWILSSDTTRAETAQMLMNFLLKIKW